MGERFSIGVDLGGTNLRVAAVSASGQLLERHGVPTEARTRTQAQVLDALSEAVAGLISRHEGPSRPLAGVGVGVSGILDARTGVLRASPSLPGWTDVPVRAALQSRLGASVVVDNDATAAAVGELWVGAARGAGGVCMLTLGTGVGGGLVLDGRPWRGMNGMAGELGHMTVRPDGPPCNCGSRGCLEQYASAAAVDRRARESTELARALEGVAAGAGAERIGQLGAEGVTAAREVFREVGEALGTALAGLVNAFNLPAYVVGGGVSLAWDLFAPALFAELRSRSFVYAATAPAGAAAEEGATRVLQSALPMDAGLFGAARMALGEDAARTGDAA